MQSSSKPEQPKPRITTNGSQPQPQSKQFFSAGIKRSFDDFDVDDFGKDNFEPIIKTRPNRSRADARPSQPATLKREPFGPWLVKPPRDVIRKDARFGELKTLNRRVDARPRRMAPHVTRKGPTRDATDGFNIDLAQFRSESAAKAKVLDLILAEVRRNLDNLTFPKVQPGRNRFRLQVRVESKSGWRSRLDIPSQLHRKGEAGAFKTVKRGVQPREHSDEPVLENEPGSLGARRREKSGGSEGAEMKGQGEKSASRTERKTTLTKLRKLKNT